MTDTIEECSVDFCNRPAAVIAKNAKIKVCKGHYQQDYNGREFQPFRVYKDTPQDENGRVCTGCERYKPWDEFYKRTGRTHKQARCKTCMVNEERERQESRKALGIPCSTEGCGRAAHTKGMCQNCYGRDYYERNKTTK